MTSLYLSDGHSGVRQLTDAAAVVTDSYVYDALGIKTFSAGLTSNLHLYRAEAFDPIIEQYYLRARYLNPATGRFESTDPLPGHANRPITLHRYLYAGGDPVSFIDPSGLEFSLGGMLVPHP